MPRANDKPFKCWADYEKLIPACRFCTVREDNSCNGPYGVCELDPMHTRCWREFGCYRGEPRVQRSCPNCKRVEFCSIEEILRERDISTDNWSCSEWEAAK